MASGNGNGTVTRDPETDRARLKAIHAAMASGDIAGAGKQAEDALADGIDHVMVLSLVAGRREEEGRFGEALELLRRAKRAAPQAAGIANQVGLCLSRMGRHEQAAAEFGEALARDPGFAPALANRGAALMALARPGEARRDFEAAAALDGANLIALNGLATLALGRGEAGEARRLAQAVLAREPGFPGAVLTLAGADLAEGRPGDAELGLRPLLGDARVVPIDRAIAWGLLGDAFDREGRFAEAFGAWREAVALSELERPRRTGPSPALLRDLARTLRDRRIPAAWGRGEARRHVFIAGFPGAGGDILAGMLAGQGDVACLDEPDRLAEPAREWLSGAATFALFLDAPDDALERHRDSYWQQARGSEGAAAVVDAHPLNLLRLPLIARLFPEARVLIAWRDPRDLVLERFRAGLDTLEGAADALAAAMELAAACEAAFGLYLHAVTLDAPAEDFEAEAKAMGDFIGLAPVGPVPGAGGAGRWRDYADQMAAVLPVLERFVDKAAPGP